MRAKANRKGTFLHARNVRIIGRSELTVLVGWSQVVAGHRLRSGGPLNTDQRTWLELVTGSGPVLSASFGFAAAGG